jgi:hypothetical protein
MERRDVIVKWGIPRNRIGVGHLFHLSRDIMEAILGDDWWRDGKFATLQAPPNKNLNFNSLTLNFDGLLQSREQEIWLDFITMDKTEEIWVLNRELIRRKMSGRERFKAYFMTGPSQSDVLGEIVAKNHLIQVPNKPSWRMALFQGILQSFVYTHQL